MINRSRTAFDHAYSRRLSAALASFTPPRRRHPILLRHIPPSCQAQYRDIPLCDFVQCSGLLSTVVSHPRTRGPGDSRCSSPTGIGAQALAGPLCRRKQALAHRTEDVARPMYRGSIEGVEYLYRRRPLLPHTAFVQHYHYFVLPSRSHPLSLLNHDGCHHLHEPRRRQSRQKNHLEPLLSYSDHQGCGAREFLRALSTPACSACGPCLCWCTHLDLPHRRPC